MPLGAKWRPRASASSAGLEMTSQLDLHNRRTSRNTSRQAKTSDSCHFARTPHFPESDNSKIRVFFLPARASRAMEVGAWNMETQSNVIRLSKEDIPLITKPTSDSSWTRWRICCECTENASRDRAILHLPSSNVDLCLHATQRRISNRYTMERLFSMMSSCSQL